MGKTGALRQRYAHEVGVKLEQNQVENKNFFRVSLERKGSLGSSLPSKCP